jgi:hypothetical protein
MMVMKGRKKRQKRNRDISQRIRRQWSWFLIYFLFYFHEVLEPTVHLAKIWMNHIIQYYLIFHDIVNFFFSRHDKVAASVGWCSAYLWIITLTGPIMPLANILVASILELLPKIIIINNSDFGWIIIKFLFENPSCRIWGIKRIWVLHIALVIP